MSGQYGRLSCARDKAHPITPETRVEVLASDLDAVLKHYAAMSEELANLKAAHSWRQISWTCPVCCASVEVLDPLVQSGTGKLYIGGTHDGT